MLKKSIKIPHQSRYQAIDLIRGLAVLGMIIYHGMYVLVYMDQGLIWGPSPVARSFGWLVAFTFLTVFGVSAGIKYQRMVIKKVAFRQIYASFVKRGLELVIAALLVTLGSLLLLPDLYIRFGVLHFFALSCLILPLLITNNRRIAFASVLILIAWATKPFWQFTPGTSLLLPLDLRPLNYATIDHWTLIPFFILPLIGAWYGKKLVDRSNQTTDNSITINSKQVSNSSWQKPILWLGQHSLLVYLIHVPILILICWLILRVSEILS